MEFWGVEVKAGETLKVSLEEGKVIHLSQAALGDSKKGKGENVPVFVKVNEQKLVMGTLSSDKFPQIPYDVVFDGDFELSHNWKNGSVFFCGYKTQNPVEYEGSSDDEFERDSQLALENGKSIADMAKPTPSVNIEDAEADTMDRVREVFGKRRRSDGEGSSTTPIRRIPTPPTNSVQNEGTPPIQPTELTPYPFATRFQFVDEMKERENKFRNFTVLTPIFPDIQFMKDDLMILDDVKDYFDAHDMSFVFGDDPGVYRKVVREFHYSFEPVYGFERVDELSHKTVASWKFQMGGRAFEVGESDLRVAFGLQRHDGCVPIPKDIRDQFWRKITKLHKDYKAAGKATDIQLPIWKFVHRFIATCILLRTDEGRWVNSDDLTIMCAMHENVDFDPLYYITRSLEECHLKSFRGRYLSGGHFITLLARFLRFSLDTSLELPRRTLGASELVSRGFVRRMTMEGGPGYRVIGMNDAPRESTRTTQRPVEDQPDLSAPRTTSGSYEDVIRRLDDLTTYSHDMSTWHVDMMRGLYTHLGYSGYRSPPRPNFRYITPRAAEHDPMDTTFGNLSGDL